VRYFFKNPFVIFYSHRNIKVRWRNCFLLWENNHTAHTLSKEYDKVFDSIYKGEEITIFWEKCWWAVCIMIRRTNTIKKIPQKVSIIRKEHAESIWAYQINKQLVDRKHYAWYYNWIFNSQLSSGRSKYQVAS